MPINTESKQYQQFKGKWERCRHAIAGGDEIKAHSNKYVPRLQDQKDAEYNAYVNRPEFYNACGRTVQGMSGAVFRHDPATDKVPQALEPLLTDVTRNGRPLASFAKDVLEEDLRVGRLGLLVDMPPAGSENARPYVVLYKAEQIINLRTIVKDGKRVLSMVVLKVCKEVPKAGDEYATDEEDRWLELKLIAGVYVQQLWKRKKNDDGTEQDKFEPDGPAIVPVRREQPLDFIPFVIINASNTDPEIDNPPLLDLVDVNLSHFRTSCDLEHGAHFTALPTPWVVGASNTGELRIGSTRAWVLPPNAHSKAGMLEFSGAGLKSLMDIIDRKEKRMAVLGARLLEQQPAQAETMGAVRLRQSGDESVMIRLANTVSAGLTRAVQWMAWWLSTVQVSDSSVQDITVTLNTDLLQTKLAAPEITALMGLFQGGGISYSTLFFNLQQGELIPPGVTEEEEAKAIEADEAKRLELKVEETEALAPPAPVGGAV